MAATAYPFPNKDGSTTVVLEEDLLNQLYKEVLSLRQQVLDLQSQLEGIEKQDSYE